jgi:hypothetical protein
LEVDDVAIFLVKLTEPEPGLLQARPKCFWAWRELAAVRVETPLLLELVMSVTVCMERLTEQVTYLWKFQTNVSGGYQRERNAYNVKE